MRLSRVYLPAALQSGARLELPEASAAHLVRVLRLSVGAEIAVFDGDGHEYAARIAEARGVRVTVEIEAARLPAAEASLPVTLVQGIARAERMDWTVQKATELGVRRIVPLKTEHALVRLDAESGARKQAHWQAVAVAACEQCGRATLPEVAPPQTLAEFLAARRDGPTAAGELGIVLDPRAGRGLSSLAAPPAAVTVLIGPEGGLAATEIGLATQQGFAPLRLGPRVLRTETAALAALSALGTLFGDLAR